ncbi:MAG: hypothetical protein IKU86_08755, partial [Thermoguttaceae bacterium]|nr:hypothetical protein [Thermoguttaceae bacterium]
CSPGAYETIQADLFWIGGEFTQEQIDAAPKNFVFSNLKRGYNAATGTQFSGTIEWTLPTSGTQINAQSSVNGAPWRALPNLSGDSVSRSAAGIPVGTTIYRFQVVLESGLESAWGYIKLNFDESLQTGDVAPYSSGIETELSPKFDASAGWATSRFAKTSGAVAPNNVNSAFIDVGGSTSEVLKTPSLGIAIGGGRKLGLATNSADTSANGVNATQCAQITLGVGAEISTAVMSGYFSAPKVRLASNARFDAILRYSSTTGVDLWSESDAWIRSAIYPAGAVWPNVFYESLSVARTSRGAGGLDGAYNCGTFSRAKGVDDSTYAIGAAPGTSIRCQNFECGVAFVYGKFFSNQVDVKLYGDATAIETRSDAATYDASDDFTVDVSETTSATLTLGGQTVYGDAPTSAIELNGSARINERGLTAKSLTLDANSKLTLENATLRIRSIATPAGSQIDGQGRVAFAEGPVWENEGVAINGDVADVYDAKSNDVKISVSFDASEILGEGVDGTYRWTSPSFASGAICPVFSKHCFDENGKGDYRTIYDANVPIVDATKPVYETDADWNGETLKTVVDAAPETGWNFYRVETPPFLNVGGFKIYCGEQTPRYFVFWNADYEPEPTYYYQGDANGSFATTSDWSLTPDGVAKSEGAPTSAGAVFVVERSAILRDFPNDAFQVSVAFPCLVEVYDASGRRLSDGEARLVSFGVPTPNDPAFCVGNGGTAGVWTHCDGATLYRVEAVDGSASGLATSSRWLEPSETEVKSWRVRVAAPIYGGVENWSTEALAVRPFSAFQEKPGYADATAGTTFELRYDENFAGVRDASVWRSEADAETPELLAQNFTGGEFTDVPETFGEYVYRVRWTPSPENVWLETTAAPWFVADGFETKTQINFITTPNRAYETPTFAARIAKKSNGELLKRQDVAKISYSLFENRDYWRTRAERLAVGPDGSYWRRNIEIPAATVRDALLVDPNFWSLDEIGANFVFSPDDGRPFFPGPGSYLVRATLETTSGRRIVVDFSTQVE